MARKKMTPVVSFGWKPDPPDHRDLIFSAPLETLRALPTSVDLRPGCPPVYDQGRIGSCTANAIAAAIQFDRRKASQKPDFVPSRLFIYFNERDLEHSIHFDAGAIIRDGIKVCNKLGVCKETKWPYNDTPPTSEEDPFPRNAPAGQRPPRAAYTEAKRYQVMEYMRVVQTLSQLKGCLAAGYPFVFGFTVYENFFDGPGEQATVTPMPSGGVLGGHAVLGVGYDDADAHFIVRNSWGPEQADEGYFYMPYSYVADADLSADFWTIRVMER
jgi:C1A family cysteine protease